MVTLLSIHVTQLTMPSTVTGAEEPAVVMPLVIRSDKALKAVMQHLTSTMQMITITNQTSMTWVIQIASTISIINKLKTSHKISIKSTRAQHPLSTRIDPKLAMEEVELPAVDPTSANAKNVRQALERRAVFQSVIRPS